MKNKIQVQCAVCDKVRLVVPSKASAAKYCGPKCYNRARCKTTNVDGKQYRKCSKSSCRRAGQLLALEEFSFLKRRQDSWCRECRNEVKKDYNRTPRGRFRASISTAKRRGIDWSLSEEKYIQLAFQPCVYCRESTGVVGVGLDRKNSQQGYVEENVVPCCCGCNRVRGEDYIPFDVMLDEIAPIIRRIKKQATCS